ncbi:hypothetical protein CC2G_000052 [Coprinopsis cinerea AmutBmut pab1-1]|nr:hypothetical protein CC2G_000052 [Coprinopsis cinerea AmutBmut pab1-1]
MFRAALLPVIFNQVVLNSSPGVQTLHEIIKENKDILRHVKSLVLQLSSRQTAGSWASEPSNLGAVISLLKENVEELHIQSDAGHLQWDELSVTIRGAIENLMRHGHLCTLQLTRMRFSRGSFDSLNWTWLKELSLCWVSVILCEGESPSSENSEPVSLTTLKVHHSDLWQLADRSRYPHLRTLMMDEWTWHRASDSIEDIIHSSNNLDSFDLVSGTNPRGKMRRAFPFPNVRLHLPAIGMDGSSVWTLLDEAAQIVSRNTAEDKSKLRHLTVAFYHLNPDSRRDVDCKLGDQQECITSFLQVLGQEPFRALQILHLDFRTLGLGELEADSVRKMVELSAGRHKPPYKIVYMFS